jgi:transposase
MELDFTKPAPKAKTLEEAQTIIDALWSLCAEIPLLKAKIAEQEIKIAEQQKKIEELEEKLKTNSKNSSKPPSSDLFKKKKRKS